MNKSLYLLLSLNFACSTNNEQAKQVHALPDSAYTNDHRIENVFANDSTMIEHYISLLDAELRIGFVNDREDSLFNILVNKLLSGDEETDELYPNATTCAWDIGDVYYPPDSSFKIFVIEGKDCGATSQPMYASFIHLKSGKIIRDDIYGFGPITTLFSTGANSYGAVQSRWSGGNIGVVYYYLTQFSIANDTFVIVPWISGNKQKMELERYIDFESFEIESRFGFEDFTTMNYDSTRRRINFSYVKDYSQLEGNKDLTDRIPKHLLPFRDNEILLVSGEFEIFNQKIANFKEKFQKQKVSD